VWFSDVLFQKGGVWRSQDAPGPETSDRLHPEADGSGKV